MSFFHSLKPQTKGSTSASSAAENGGSSSKPQVLPWVEKYRPHHIHEVVYQTETVEGLRKTLQQPANLPHMLFYGPPGTGKTTTILAICRDLFGPEYMKTRVKELNASDDRGIDVVRQKLKKFAQTAVTQKPNQEQNGTFYPVPPYKVIILDEADALLPDTQAALRRMMEDFSSTTRFCLICNYLSRIIDPITSRCVKCRFKPLPAESIHSRIRYICEQEQLQINDPALKSLESVSGGDLRMAITYLQGAATLFGSNLADVDFSDIGGCVPAAVMTDFVASLFSGSFENVESQVSSLTHNGFAATQIFSQLHDILVQVPEEQLPSILKAQLMLRLSSVDKALQDGSDEYLQLLSFSMFAARIIKRH